MDCNLAERVRQYNSEQCGIEKTSLKRTYTPFELKGILGLSLSRVYVLIKDAPFSVIKSGQHYFISKNSFDEWYANQSEEVAENGD